MLHPHLIVFNNLRWVARLLDMAGPNDEATGILERVGLFFAITKPRAYPAGITKRLAIARSFLGAPSILVLEELQARLDLRGYAFLNRMLTDYREQAAP